MQLRRASSSRGVRPNDIHQLEMPHEYLSAAATANTAAAAAGSWRQRFVPLPFHWVYLEHAFFQLIMPTFVPHKVINPNHGVHFHTCQGIIHHLASFYPLRWAACTCISALHLLSHPVCITTALYIMRLLLNDARLCLAKRGILFLSLLLHSDSPQNPELDFLSSYACR